MKSTLWFDYIHTVTASSSTDFSTPLNLLTSTGTVYSGSFTAGNVALEVLGSSSAGNGNQVSIKEYSISGTTATLANIYDFPGTTCASSSGPYLTDISASTTGYANCSSDGSFISVPGYNATTGATEPTSGNAIAGLTGDILARSIGNVGSNGNVSVNSLPLNVQMTYAFRSVVSNGVSYWGGGTSNTNTPNGYSLVYMKDNTAVPLVNLSTTTMRGIGIGSGNLYYIAQGTNGAVGLFQVGANGLPITTPNSNPVNILADGVYPTIGNPETFCMNSGGTILYLADNATFTNNSTEKGGILRFNYNSVTGKWEFQYTLATSGANVAAQGVTVDWPGSTSNPGANPIVYATTTANTLTKIVDDGSKTAGTVILTATGGTSFRGVSMAPTSSATPTLLCTATQVVFPATLPAHKSAEQAFNVSGYNLGAQNVTVTAPAGFNISTTSGAEGSNTSVTIVPSGGVANQVVYMVFNPTIAQSYSSVPPYSTNPSTYLSITDAAAGATALGVPVSAVSVNAFYYYNLKNVDITLRTSWVDASNDTVPNFTGDGQIFNLDSTGYSQTQNFAISGTASKLVVGNGTDAINYIIPAAYTYTGTVDVSANATLTISNATIPALGTLDPASTVVYNYDGAVTIPNAIYGNLSLVGASNPATDVFTFNKTTGTALTINGNFLASKVAVMGAIQSPFTTMYLGGNFTASSGATFGYAPPAAFPGETQNLISVSTVGNGNQTFSYTGGGTIILATLSSVKNSGIFTVDNNTTLVMAISVTFNYSGTASFVSNTGSSFNTTYNVGNLNLNFSNNSTFSLGGNMSTADNTSASFTITPGAPKSALFCNFADNATFTDNGNTITLSYDFGMAGVPTAYNLTGAVLVTPGSSGAFIESDASKGVIVAQLNNLTIAPPTGAGNITVQPAAGSAIVTVNGNLTIGGTSTTSKLNLDGNTINLGGNFADSRTIDMLSNTIGNKIVFDGNSPQTFTSNYSAGESINNVTVSNASGVTFTGSSIMDIVSPGALTLTTGTISTGSGKVVLGATSTVSESNTSYVIGKVTSTRPLSMGTNETFGGMGIEVVALNASPGSTLVTRVIGGAEGSIGCIGHSILRNFTVAPTSNTSLNATVVFHYFDSPLELNGFNEADLTLFESTNGGSSWSALTTANNVGANTLTSTGLGSLSLFSAGTATPAGGTVNPPLSIVCSSTSQTLTVSGYKGNLQWQSSTDNVNWTTIPSATNATYSATGLSVPGGNTYYRSYSSYPGCLDVASTTATVGLSNPTITPTITNISANSVTLDWTPVGSGNYNYTYTGASSGGGLGKTPPYTVTGLSSGSNYSITINQANVTGCSASGTVSATTLCGAPTLSSNSTGNNNINISWSSTGASAYRVFFRPLGVTNTYFTQDVTGATSVNLTKNGTAPLYPGTTYEIYVAGLNCPTANAIGAASNYVYATTTPLSGCAVPTITNVQSICPVQLEVFVSSGSTTNFNITVQRLTPTIYAAASYSVSGGYLSLAITPGQTYLVAVKANCSGTYSSMVIWPGNVTSKPLCNGLSNYIVSNPTCKGFSASWNADQCVTSTLSYYQIHLRKVGAINWNLYQVGSNPYTTVTWLGGAGSQFDSYVTSVYSCDNVSAVGNASQTQRIALLSAGCRDEEGTQPEEIQPAVQQISADNTEVFSLYPNPNNGQFMVDISSLSTVDQDVRVEVMNMLGQTVVTQFATTENGHYNQFVRVPNNVSSGMYLVRVTVGKNVYTSKIDISK